MAGSPSKNPIRRTGFSVFPLELRREERPAYLRMLDVSAEGVVLLGRRMDALLLQAEGVDARAANILKQDMLSAGGDVALPQTVSRFTPGPVKLCLMGTRREYRHLCEGLRAQPYGLKGLGTEIQECLKRIEVPRRLLVRGRDLLEGRRFLIMGVVNVTPDSFYDGGRHFDAAEAIAHGLKLAEEGADILDIGAESSRPGSEPVTEDEEKRRLLPVLDGIRKALRDVPLSADTTKSEVARAALDAGADIVNDVSAGMQDPEILRLCSARKVPLVLMHMRGTPKTMQEDPRYDDVLAEVVSELRARVSEAEAAGLGPGLVAVDPGIGFGKRVEDNAALLGHLEALSCLGHPILVGASRKAFIGKIAGALPDERLPGTLAAHAAALLKGASILRVHDVKEHAQALACAAALLQSPWREKTD